MSYMFYKFIHILGLTAVVFALGGAILGTIVAKEKPAVMRRTLAITHGLGIFLILLGGFGMLARLGITGDWPWWISVKLLIWLALGAWLTVAYRISHKHPLMVWLIPLVLVATSAGVVLFK